MKRMIALMLVCSSCGPGVGATCEQDLEVKKTQLTACVQTLAFKDFIGCCEPYCEDAECDSVVAKEVKYEQR